MRRRHCSRCFYTEIKSARGGLCPSLHRILQSPWPGEHIDRCSLHRPPWFSLGTVLRMRFPRPEPGAIMLFHVPVPENSSGNGQAIGVLLPARDEWAGWSPEHGLRAPPKHEHCRCPVSRDGAR